MVAMQSIAVDALKLSARNARTHSKKQIRQIADSITTFGFVVPIVVDEDGIIIGGHGRYAAARLLDLKQVPAIEVRGLSEAKRRALALADNKIAANAGWDRQRLAIELPELAELLIKENLEISLTGFASVEIDQLATVLEQDPSDPADVADPGWAAAICVTKPGDLWELGKHRILCGDARERDDLTRLMGSRSAAMGFLDPPYNTRFSDIGGRGRIKHPEFAMASGELSLTGFVEFLNRTLTAAAAVSREGAIHYICMDWRHIGELLEAGNAVYGNVLNIAVWVKPNAGQGFFYRSQHELIAIFRVGDALHRNDIELGRHGRSRSNVWHYAGVDSVRDDRIQELQSHPPAKPVALVADAMRDCTRRGDIVLDTFSGSGATIMAAERTGRRAYVMEIEPRYVDIAIRRWQAFTRKDAVDAESGRTFDQLAAERTPDNPEGRAMRQGDEASKGTTVNREGLQTLLPDNPRDGAATAQRSPNHLPSVTPTSA